MSFWDKVPVVSSYRKSSEADEMIEQGERWIRNANWALEDAQEASKAIIEKLIDDKAYYIGSLIPQVLDTLSKCQQVNNLDTKIAQDAYIEFSQHIAPKLRHESTVFTDIVSTGIKGTTTGAALALGSMGAVSSLGAASTGTAIATLSGAAAQNATLAWFGGGAISAGGAGIAGGTMVLGGIVLAPLAVFGAYKYSQHAEKKLTEARIFRDKADAYDEEIKVVVEVMSAVNNHVDLYKSTLKGIADRLSNTDNRLNDALHIKDDPSNINRYKLQAILLTKALKSLLSIDLLTEEQKPTPQSLKVISHAEHLNDSTIDSFIAKLEQDKNEINSSQNIDQFEAGNDSATYFWLYDKKITKSANKNIKTKLITCILLILCFGWLSSLFFK
ncbi:TPA: hypothetical protein ACX6R5_003278 [Photobacterium damselae]